MHVLIIEDEPLAAQRLETMLKAVKQDIRVLAKIGPVKEALRWLNQHTADLIFLDIQLSDGLSFRIFEELQLQTPVIFVTAYDQYAIQAFQLNSIAYLLKPVRQEALAESLDKYQSLRAAFRIDFESLMESMQGGLSYKKRFLIQVGERFKKIETAEIACFYAFQKGNYLKTYANYTLPVEYALDRIEQMVDPEVFFRINRKYIVHINAIAKMTAWSRSRMKLELEPPVEQGLEAVVSVERAAKFREWLDS